MKEDNNMKENTIRSKFLFFMLKIVSCFMVGAFGLAILLTGVHAQAIECTPAAFEALGLVDEEFNFPVSIISAEMDN